MRRVRVEGGRFNGRIPDGAIYVGRAAPYMRRSPYCNPYTIKAFGLEESRRRFRQHLLDDPDLVEQARRDLTGHDLACWCGPDVDWCHVEDWLRILDGTNPQQLLGQAATHRQ